MSSFTDHLPGSFAVSISGSFAVSISGMDYLLGFFIIHAFVAGPLGCITVSISIMGYIWSSFAVSISVRDYLFGSFVVAPSQIAS